jgi:menaquinone-dependent protoporphyrinogen oxidase
MASILIVYSTVDGQTLKICQRMQYQLSTTWHHNVTLLQLENDTTPQFDAFDMVIVGASIRYGRHRQCVYDFVRHHRSRLDRIRNAFFSVNVVARKPEKSDPESNPYVRKFLRRIEWRPQNVAVFAGRIDYKRYRFWDRQMIRLIMWMTHGPTDPSTDIEFTDWDKVDRFAHTLGSI